MYRLLSLICLACLGFTAAPAAYAQDLASQLASTVTAQQRAYFDFLSLDGAYRLEGGLNGAGALIAELPDADLAYEVGQQIVWQLESQAGGRLYLFDVGASGGARQVLPNAFVDPRPMPAGLARLVPSADDGTTVFMGADSRVQVWLAIVVTGGAALDVPLVGDPRLGEVSGGASGLLDYIGGEAAIGLPMEFALTVFGQTTPPLPTQDVERTLGLDRDQSAQVQARLNELGFDVGVADGLFGRNTRSGLSAWQASIGVDQTGYLNTYTLRRLLEQL